MKMLMSTLFFFSFPPMQRAAPKTFDQQMTNLQTKIEAKEDTITETKAEIKALKKEARSTKDAKTTK